jgi:hypothetical protein
VPICSRLLSGRDEPEKNELGFMYAAPPGLKQQQEKEEEQQARQQQLDNINLGDDREKFLQSIAVRTKAYACPPGCGSTLILTCQLQLNDVPALYHMNTLDSPATQTPQF